MIFESIRLSESAKRQLINIKRRTGIDQWNILCRWAFCISVAENNQIGLSTLNAGSNVEMTWKTFAGRNSDIYEAIVRFSVAKSQSPEVSELAFIVGHIERGISRLASMKEMTSIADFIEVAIGSGDKKGEATHNQSGPFKTFDDGDSEFIPYDAPSINRRSSSPIKPS